MALFYLYLDTFQTGGTKFWSKHRILEIASFKDLDSKIFYFKLRMDPEAHIKIPLRKSVFLRF